MGAVTPQSKSAGRDGARFPRASVGFRDTEGQAWRKAFSNALRWPWFERSTDGQPIPPIAAPEPFEALKAFAASGSAGCVKARERLKHATNAGLAAALGRSLPEALTQ